MRFWAGTKAFLQIFPHSFRASEHNKTSMLTPNQIRPTKDWTVLYYGGGVNNLNQSIQQAWKSLEGENLPANVDTFVRHIDKEGLSQDLYIDQNGRSQVLASSGEQIESSDPSTLADFLSRGVSTYPAERYLVVLSSHGRGAEGVVEDDIQHKIMKPHELQEAMELGKKANAGRPFDVVLFDACRMAAVEVALELSGSALVSVASMDNIADMGYDLAEVIRTTAVSGDAIELGRELVQNRQSKQLDAMNTLSAVDLSKVDKLGSALRDLSACIQGLDGESLESVRQHAQQSRRNRASPMSEYGNALLADSILAEGKNTSDALELWLENEKPGDAVSLVSFCNRLLADEHLMSRRPELGEAAKKVHGAHNTAVFRYRAEDENEDPGGLTVSMPLNNKIGPLYDSPLRFEKSAGWEAAYNTILPEGEAIEPQKTWLEQALEEHAT